MLLLLAPNCQAQRIQQPLGRGVVAVYGSSNGTAGVEITWRRLAQEPEDLKYNVYVSKTEIGDFTKINTTPLTNTNYATSLSKVPYGSYVAVSTVKGGIEGEKSKPFHFLQQSLRNIYMEIRYDKSPLDKKKFTTKYCINLANRFSEENINHVFDSIIDLVSDEFCASGGDDSRLSSMRKFALERPQNIYKHLKYYVDGDSVVNFSINSDVDGAVFALNGEKINNFNGKYIAGYDFDIQAYAPAGYKFVGWEISDSSSIKSLATSGAKEAYVPGTMSGILKKSVNIWAIFKKCDEALPTLVINEVCASSDSKSANADDYHSYPDWIELYNYGEKDIDLSGFIITNSKNNMVSQLPLNSNMIIKAGGYKVLWAKGDNSLGAKYLNFKLDNDKPSTIGLSYLNVADQIDQIKFVSHSTNYSYGRAQDNGEKWKIFTMCLNEDLYSATPGKATGSVCELLSVDEGLALTEEPTVRIYPNPVSDVLNIESDETVEAVAIYSMSGSMVINEVGDVNAVNVHSLPKGIYMLETVTAGSTQRMKLIKR